MDRPDFLGRVATTLVGGDGNKSVTADINLVRTVGPGAEAVANLVIVDVDHVIQILAIGP
ncbi:hypothetical protein D3C80_2027290 [compost metagenome]